MVPVCKSKARRLILDVVISSLHSWQSRSGCPEHLRHPNTMARPLTSGWVARGSPAAGMVRAMRTISDIVDPSMQ